VTENFASGMTKEDDCYGGDGRWEPLLDPTAAAEQMEPYITQDEAEEAQNESRKDSRMPEQGNEEKE